MPTDVLSLLLYVGLLLPGFAFTAARSQHRPIEVRSAFLETTAAVFVSVVCDGILLASGLGAGLILGADNQLGIALRDPAATYRSQPVPVVLGTMLFLVLATLVGLGLGTQRAHLIGAALLRSRDERRGSTWHQIFDTAKPEGTTSILVEIELTDGSGIQGLLSTFDRLGTDNGDRGLVLSSAIARRRMDDHAFVQVDGFSTVAVTDRNIRSLQVTYLNEPWPPTDPPTSPD